MAVLTDEQRREALAEMMRELSNSRVAFPLTKAELLAFLSAIDDWLDANSASFNSALPAAARTQLSLSEKARGLVFVVRQRFLKGA